MSDGHTTEETAALLRRAQTFLMWVDEHTGERVADHKSIRGRLAILISEIREHLVYV